MAIVQVVVVAYKAPISGQPTWSNITVTSQHNTYNTLNDI
jgi:hypothetical protein